MAKEKRKTEGYGTKKQRESQWRTEKRQTCRDRHWKAANSASSHHSHRFMSDSSQRPKWVSRSCHRTPSALFHHESFMCGKITSRRAKRLDGWRRRKKKSRSPLRQKASVVPKSMLICKLADPVIAEAVVKKRKRVRLFYSHLPPRGQSWYWNRAWGLVLKLGFDLCPL